MSEQMPVDPVALRVADLVKSQMGTLLFELCQANAKIEQLTRDLHETRALVVAASQRTHESRL